MLLRRADLDLAGTEPNETGQPSASRVAGNVRSAVGHKGVPLQELIGELHHDEHIHIPSMGAWSMHHVLAHVLEQTGPAEIWFTTWTINADAIQSIIDRLESGAITRAKAIVSDRLESMNPRIHQLLRFNIDVRFTKLHAKCLVVMNDQWGVSVGGSANFTRNPRIEKYIICTHREQAIADRSWIEAVHQGADPFTRSNDV